MRGLMHFIPNGCSHSTVRYKISTHVNPVHISRDITCGEH